MKKVAIITFHSSHNCGSMLQSLALKTIIETRFNANVQFIDFANKGSDQKYAFYLPKNSLKNIAKNMLYFYYFKVVNSNYFDYEEFKNKHLPLTDKSYKSIEGMEALEPEFDIFISGSDQIWNITCNDADDAYFLPFITNKRKIAYAPSLGAKSITKYAKDVDQYKKYLEDYDMLSVREFNGQKWLQELTDKEIEVICDPTVLLTSEDYDKFSKPVNIKRKYIFYYSYGYVENENAFVQKVADLFDLDVITFNGKRWATIHRRYSRFILPDCEGPASFLYIVKHAEMIITSSFHGTVFSTIYHKKFWVIKNDGMTKGDDRASSILSQLGLSDRFIEETAPLDKEMLSKPIDYTIVDANISKLRENAYSYLERAINYEKQ